MFQIVYKNYICRWIVWKKLQVEAYRMNYEKLQTTNNWKKHIIIILFRNLHHRYVKYNFSNWQNLKIYVQAASSSTWYHARTMNLRSHLQRRI